MWTQNGHKNSHRLHTNLKVFENASADIAQLVEHSIRNRKVRGSNPLIGMRVLCVFSEG